MSFHSSFTGKSCRQLVAQHANADEVEREAVRIASQRRAEADAEANEDTVWVGTDDLREDHGSVVIFTGHDAHGRVVRFAVDHRVAAGLVEVIEAQDVVPCYVESWQVLSRATVALV